ncbi:MAG: hypothetical protein ACLFTK_16225 [Anaerolineales bacterium]
MTPVLSGRWQSRLFLMGTVGVIVTFFFGLLFDDFVTVYALLGYVFVVGALSDVAYNYIQTLRWDHDWPPLVFVATGVWEGLVVFLLTRLVNLPGVADDLPALNFLAHCTTVFVAIFIVNWGPMKVFFPKWRYRGGRIV